MSCEGVNLQRRLTLSNIGSTFDKSSLVRNVSDQRHRNESIVSMHIISYEEHSGQVSVSGGFDDKRRV